MWYRMKGIQVVRHVLFGSAAGRRAFYLLFFGFLFLTVLSLSLCSLYLLYGRSSVPVSNLAGSTNRAVTIARTIPINQLPSVVRMLSQHGIMVRMNTKPHPQAQIMQLTDPKLIREYVYQHPREFRLSFQMANGQWLNIHGHNPAHPAVRIGVWLAGVSFFFLLIFLCLWPLRHLNWPWAEMVKAVRRFGIDMDAPPLAVTGPREVQLVARAFNEMQARIRRLVHDRTQMLAAISHDLRTPITRLQLRAEQIEDHELYEKTVTDLTEMEKMISSILAFARHSNSKEPMERFDLDALLEVLCNDLQDVGQPVNYQSAETRISYFGRSIALKRAFSNLIENAVYYGHKAEVCLKIINAESLQVIIEDEGPGIPEDQMEEVFAPFYRLDGARSSKQSGAGLGMATALDIIRAHGGEISLYNKSTGGLRVVIELPTRI